MKKVVLPLVSVLVIVIIAAADILINTYHARYGLLGSPYSGFFSFIVGSEPETSGYMALAIWIVIAIVAAVVVFLVARQTPDGGQTGNVNYNQYNPQTGVYGNTQFSAENMGELLSLLEPMIKAQLKAPLTAVFCGADELILNFGGNNVYNIGGYVNSQNSYGALIKTDFKAKAMYINGRWNVIQAGMGNVVAKNLVTYYIIGTIVALGLFAISYMVISMLYF